MRWEMRKNKLIDYIAQEKAELAMRGRFIIAIILRMSHANLQSCSKLSGGAENGAGEAERYRKGTKSIPRGSYPDEHRARTAFPKSRGPQT